MKYILTVLMLWGVAQAQNIPGYTVANHRYKYLALGSDAFNLPAMGTPALATAQWVRAGALVYDSTGGNRGVHMWTGSAWIRLVDTTQNIGAELEVGVTPVTGGTTTNVLYNNGGTLGEYTTTGSGTVVPLATSPTFNTSLTAPLFIGGTATSSSLTLRTTSGVGATDAMIFQVGNNGATEGMRLNTAGELLVGGSTDNGAAKFQVNGGSSIFKGVLEVNNHAAYLDANVAFAVSDNSRNWIFNMYNSGNHLASLSRNGYFAVGPTLPSVSLAVMGQFEPSAASVVGLRVKAHASQSGNLQEWTNSSLTPLSRINAAGHFIGPNGQRAGGTLTSIYTTVGNVGTGEDNLHSYPIPANTLAVNGDWIEFEMTFNTPVSGGTIKIYYGATQLGAISANSGFPTVVVKGTIMRTGAATQRVSFVYLSGAGSPIPGYLTPTETLSGAVTLRATAEATSDNDITQVLTTVKLFPAN